MPDNKAMTESEISALLGSKIHQAMNDEDGDLSQNRQDALNYYLGKPYGNERDGYSAYVTREALEAVEWAMPSVIRVFTAGDQVVSFDPVSPQDEEQAKIETDVLNHLLMKDNDGFEAFYAWFKDALMYPNGYLKVWVDEKEEVTKEYYNELTEADLAILLEDDELEVVEQDSAVKQILTDEGPIQVELFSVKVKRTTVKPRLNIDAVEPEQVLVDNDLTSQNLDDADFVCHRVRKTYTALVQEGYDPKELDAVGNTEDYQWQDERVNRLFFEDENPDTEDDDDDSMRQFWVHECYCKIDVDGDGVAEGRKVVMIGNTIFENEELDYQPFVSLSSILMSHKHTGLSLVDLVKDIQLVSSTLMRQLLDNMYKQNIRRKYIGEGALVEDGSTIEALANTGAENIPVRDPSQIIPEQVQSIIPELIPVIDKIKDQNQVRSGVTPDMSLNPETLQQSTMGGFSMALEQASERIELITRVFAETGVKRLMRKAHRLCREYMDYELQLKLGGKWMPINPSDWRERTTMTVNVGLGFNDKTKKLQLLIGLLDQQKEALQVGMATPDNLYNTLTDMVDAAGLGSVEKYFTDPANIPPQEPQPDPQAEALNAQIQLEQGKLQAQAQKQQADAQAAQAKILLEREKLQSEQAKNAAQLELEREKLELEREKLLQDQHKHDQTTEAKLIELLGKLEGQDKGEAKEELSELDKAATEYLKGE